LLTVTTAADGAPGSLRDVVGRAAVGDVVQFAAKLRGATIHLTAGEISITQPLTIAGSGQTLDANHHSRLFNIEGANVAIRGLTLADGLATLNQDRGYVGGAIYATGSQLTLLSVTLRNNWAQGGGDSPDNTTVWNAGGGAIFADGGTLTLNNCNVLANAVQGGDNTINQQAGQAVGGAILVDQSPLIINGGQFSGNQAQGGNGVNPITGFPSSGGAWGAGGWAYGGSVFVLNNRGGSGNDPALGVPPAAFFPPGAGVGDTAYVMPVTISNTTFQANVVRGGTVGKGVQNAIHAGGAAQGGGTDLSGLMDLTITRSSWVGNMAVGGEQTLASGGGLAIVFGGATSRTNIVGGAFRNNLAIGGNNAQNSGYREADGGAILMNAPNAVITGTTFQGNSAIGGADTGSGYAGSGEGGAIMNLGQHPSLQLNACTFQGNTALGGVSRGISQGGLLNGDAYGGAIYHENGDLTIRGGFFTQNAALAAPTGANREAQGGAIYASPIDAPPGYDYVTNTYLTAVNFNANKAIAYGGGMAGGGAIANAGNILQDQGSRFTNNLAQSFGGAAYGGALLHNNLASANAIPFVPAATLRATVFSGNLAIGVNVPRGPASGFGGGIAFVNDPQALLPQVVFKKNKATTAGNDFWGTFHQNVD
jgi:hypothetical protein